MEKQAWECKKIPQLLSKILNKNFIYFVFDILFQNFPKKLGKVIMAH